MTVEKELHGGGAASEQVVVQQLVQGRNSTPACKCIEVNWQKKITMLQAG